MAGKHKTDAAALGLEPLRYPYTAAELAEARAIRQRIRAGLNRQTITDVEWLFLHRACAWWDCGRFLEIGVYRHGSTGAFLSAMVGNRSTLTTVDVEYRRPGWRYPDKDAMRRWVKITGSSLDILPLMAPGYDVIFVDGLHNDDAVERDTREALRLRSKGGVVIAHDANGASAMDAILRAVGSSEIDYYPGRDDHCKGLAVYPKGWGRR